MTHNHHRCELMLTSAADEVRVFVKMRQTPANAREQIFTALDFLMALPEPQGMPSRWRLIVIYLYFIMLIVVIISSMIDRPSLEALVPIEAQTAFYLEPRSITHPLLQCSMPKPGSVQARTLQTTRLLHPRQAPLKQQLRQGSAWGRHKRTSPPSTSRPLTCSSARSNRASCPSGSTVI